MIFEPAGQKPPDDLSKGDQAAAADSITLPGSREKVEQGKKVKPFPFGILKGKPFYIADDFDETPEGFEEYT